jgi:rod shape determining protein RodA
MKRQKQESIIAPPLAGTASADGSGQGPPPTLLQKVYTQVVPRLIASRVAWLMLLTILILCSASLIAVHICGRGLLWRQEIHILIGLAALLLAMVPKPRQIVAWGPIIYAFTLLLLVAVRFAPAIKGSHRWFILPGGFDIQPSELAKIGFVLVMSWYVRQGRDMQKLGSLLVPFVLMAIPMGLIVIEPDLGTALMFPVVLYAMLIAAGARLRHLVAIALVALAVAPGCYPFLHHYQQQRIISMFTFHKPTAHQLNGNLYQKQQSEIAEGSGGLTGQGLRGTTAIRHGLLPEASNDFIFAVVASQFGLVGGLVIIVLYILFFAACLEIADNSNDAMGRVMAVGLSTMIITQATINIGMTTGIIPVVGITLPFMSYGGSAMVADMLATSLILNVALRDRRLILSSRSE